MAKRDRMDEVKFKCAGCGHRFSAPPSRVVDAPEDPWHPWRYEADCKQCGGTADQDPVERRMLKMWAHATGPKTAEGKAASAANLAGHPTPEEAQRTRFNALQHGLHARAATYFPARPGKYAQCEGCEYLHNICWQQTACLKRTELFLLHHVAFETKNPALLSELNADTHANLRAIFDDMIRAVLIDGARLESPEWYYDKEGEFHLAEYPDEDGKPVRIMKKEAHPLLARMKDLLQALNIGLAELGMTPRQIEKEDEIKGQLSSTNESSREAALEYQRRQTEALEQLSSLVNRSRDAAKRDPVLIEYQKQDPDAAE